MINFYKIINTLPIIGSGVKVPEGFIEYVIGKEPKDLVDAIKLEQFQNEKQLQIVELKQLLRETDYVILSDYDQEKPDVIAQRAAWRAEIRELEND